MKTKATRCLLASSFLLTATAHAQGTFSIGPRVGLNVAAVHFPDPSFSSYTRRTGFEFGLLGNVQFGHFALQPSVLFSQRGYRSTGFLPGFESLGTYDEQVRLNYLTVPLNLAFTLGKAGQGLQVFGGAYMSLLLGGNYVQQAHYTAYAGGVPYNVETSGKVKPANQVADFDSRYARRVDAGFQTGIGYRLGRLLVQTSYSVGLRNLRVTAYSAQNNYTYDGPAYYNRAFQAAVSYLVGPKG